MDQKETLAKLKENDRQAKQLNEVLTLISDAIKKEMPTYMKLVQFDVLAELQKKAVADGVTNNNSAEKQLTQDLDKIFAQINKDLETQIIKKCEEIKA